MNPRDVLDHLEIKAAHLQQTAKMLPHGTPRDALVRRAGKMEAAALVIEKWASSPGLRAPK